MAIIEIIGILAIAIVFLLSFLCVAGGVVLVFVLLVRKNNKNHNSPRLDVPAVVVAKRADFSHSHGDDSIHHSTASTSYFVTFQVDSGDRMEFRMSGYDYGLLAEGDAGVLSFQGTQYNGFQRT